MRIAVLLSSLLFSFPTAWAAEASPCAFDGATLQFKGSPVEQAACLLRQVGQWGKISPGPATLPAGLAQRIGQPTGQLRTQLAKYLSARHIAPNDIGGPLGSGVSKTPTGKPAAYFVIHDTSSPFLGAVAGFPPDDAPKLNSLASYGGPNAVAHVFVNRLGKTLLGHDFSVPWRATKLETKVLGDAGKGLFLHVELLQPRRSDPSGPTGNDALAPTPGFTAQQYKALALLYASASVRRGTWLVPAFHAALDEGRSDAHDDPQHFELQRFGEAFDALLQELVNPA
jgi:hypothetical protein